MKVGIIGAGAWGTALACGIARIGHDVVLWAFDLALAQDMQRDRTNDSLPDVIIPENVFITNDMETACKTDIWIIAVPSEFFSETLQKSREFYKNQPVISAAKGINPDGMLMSDIIQKSLNGAVGVISGPGFARELALGKLTGSVIAGVDTVVDAAREIFADLVLEDTEDITGVQLCGAGKNIVAILMGYLDGQGAGENERALKLCQTWAEITDLGIALGADKDTFSGLAGMGDLFLSAGSRTSRNYEAGLDLAAMRKPTGTTEGIISLRGLLKLAEKTGVFMPNVNFLASLTGV
ncbi:MAG: NAD(P)H-dependent glycerol-3-phosphate dehydrogenase [Alphaproteobacteria bacterium]|nr:NAD(P)H-dependent glycerol-3-phosphate dehydrogenase [Alphaproteobacteria bacterium]